MPPCIYILCDRLRALYLLILQCFKSQHSNSEKRDPALHFECSPHFLRFRHPNQKTGGIVERLRSLAELWLHCDFYSLRFQPAALSFLMLVFSPNLRTPLPRSFKPGRPDRAASPKLGGLGVRGGDTKRGRRRHGLCRSWAQVSTCIYVTWIRCKSFTSGDRCGGQKPRSFYAWLLCPTNPLAPCNGTVISIETTVYNDTLTSFANSDTIDTFVTCGEQTRGRPFEVLRSLLNRRVMLRFFVLLRSPCC